MVIAYSLQKFMSSIFVMIFNKPVCLFLTQDIIINDDVDSADLDTDASSILENDSESQHDILTDQGDIRYDVTTSLAHLSL